MTQTNDKTNEVKPDSFLSSSDEHMAASSITGKGYLTGPGLHEFPVDYVVVDGLAIHEGCIEMGSVEAVEAEAARIRAAHQHQKTTEAGGSTDDLTEFVTPRGVGLPSNSSFLWTNGIVPYTIASDVPDKGRVDDAIRHIEEMTAIRFVKRTTANAQRYPNYIEIISNGDKDVSSSAIGMRGGKQFVRYADKHAWPILVHEFLHALGVYHEQSRSDRDDFVEIHWNNIKDGPPPEDETNALGNFQKKPDAINYYDYDYDSIMHYGRFNFRKDPSKPTITPLKPGVTIGQRDGMSYGDRQTIAKMYERFFPRGYAGVWRAGTGRYGLWVNAEWSSFVSKWQEWSNDGLRLHDIHVRQVGDRTLYSGVFLPGTGRYGLWANVDWDSFVAKWQEWSSQGLRLVSLNTHLSGNQVRYSGVFLPGTGRYGLWANVGWDSFVAKWQEWSNEGLRLTNLDVVQVGNQTRYSGVFLPGNGGHGLWANVEWSSFVAKWQEWSSQGLRLVDLDMHQVGDSLRYSGVFLPGNDSHYLWANVTYDSLIAKWQELAGRGLRLVNLEIASIASRTARSADVGFEGDGEADEITNLPLEEFGGIFGEETLNQSSAQALQENGGGGIGGEEAIGDADKTENHGGAFSSNPEAEVISDEPFGGAFFEGLSVPANGYGNPEKVFS